MPVTRLSLSEYAAVQREREPVRNLVGGRVRFSRRVVQAFGLSASDSRLILGAGRKVRRQARRFPYRLAA
jgi:hypothetical protein